MAPGCLSAQAQPILLDGSGLTLRPWLDSDAPALVKAYEDPDIFRWHCRSLSLVEAESWVAHERQRWQQDLGCSWAITQNGSLIGRVGVGAVHLDEGRAGATYWVLPWARGQGVAPLALGAVVEWAFDRVGFHRLEVHHSTANQASCRVATKAGFAAEGTKRALGLHLDGWHDMHAHALLAADPRPAVPGKA